MPSPLVFLSHSGADAESAIALARRLEESPLGREHGLRVWVDKRDLVPGPQWKEQLQDALKRSTAFAVYVGSKRVVNWVWDEVSVALDLAHQRADYRVIPILAAHARIDELPSFLSLHQGVRDVEHDAEAFAALLRGLLRLDARTQVQAEAEPFQGLEAFTSERAHLFFGRDQETEELLSLLRTEPLVMVVGDSGSGKSSLVKAGLVPRFRGGGLSDRTHHDEDTLWRVIESRPLTDPFETLAQAVLEDAQANGKGIKECSDLADLVRSRNPSSVRDALQLSAPTGARTKTLLVLDQFEELFTLSAVDGQATFADVLLGLADAPDDRIRVVLTMRWDYYHLCSSTPELYARLERQDRYARYALRRMSVENLERCVSEPLRLAGVSEAASRALAAAVLKDVGERPNDLALLEMALKQAWIKRAQHDDDLLRAYVAIGRVDGALAMAADEIVASHLTVAEQSIVEPLFIRLVKLGDTGGATRRIAHQRELDGGRWELAQKLATGAGGRLVVVAGDHAEIAHEALVTSWPRYVSWLRNDSVTNDLRSDDKRHLDGLMDDTERWAAASETQRPLHLAHGFDLDRYEGLQARRPLWLCEGERRFIESSAQERDRVRDKERKDARNLKRLVYVAAFLGCVAIGFAVAARLQTTAARTAERASAASAAQAYLFDAGDSSVSSVVRAANAAAAVAVTPEAAIARAGLLSHLSRIVVPLVKVEQPDVMSARFSPDGTRIVTASEGGTARVWDARTGASIGGPLQHTDPVKSAAFSPDGTRVVTASRDGARVWDARTGTPVGAPLRHTDSVRSAEFSSDGTRIVTASEDGTARVWDAHTGAPIGAPLQHRRRVQSAEFSPDGLRIVTASYDRTARVWDTQTGAPISAPLQHTDLVYSAEFSPDGTRVVTASSDGTARVWDARTGAPMGAPLQHMGSVQSVEFSPDGTRIVTASHDGTARIWETGTAAPFSVPLQHTRPVQSAEFSSDGTRIVTASFDETARVWDARTGTPVGAPLQHAGLVYSAKFSPDGTRIVTASLDGTARVWDARTGNLIGARLEQKNVASVGFSPDGTRIITASGDRTARVWDASTGAPIGSPLQHSGSVQSAEFSPDGTRIVTASDDMTARVWDTRTGAPIGASLQHTEYVNSARFSPDGTRIITASANSARVWDARTGAPISPPLQHTRFVESAEFSRDGTRVVTASGDGTARIWDARTGASIGAPLQHTGNVNSARFSPDSTRVVTASGDGTARVWDARTGAPIGAPLQHTDLVYLAEFSPDGTRVVTASNDKTARVWDARSGAPVGAPLQHTGNVNSARFSPDGTRIVTASGDSARVWDARTGAPVGAPLHHTDSVYSAEFSPDGTRIVTHNGPDHVVTAYAWFSPSAPDRRAHVWDARALSNESSKDLLDLTELLLEGHMRGPRDFAPGVADRNSRLHAWRERALNWANAPDGSFEQWVHWYFADPTTRPNQPGLWR